MDRASGKLTVFFGVEPKNYEVQAYIQKYYFSLKFSPAVDTTVKETKRNPKRMQREAKKQMQEIGIGTKSQQALKLQQKQNKQERKVKIYERKEKSTRVISPLTFSNRKLWRYNMATLHMMVGLPGSGKTTEAKKLEQEFHALRLTPDEWQYFLFGHDISDPEHDERHTKVEELMWEIAVKVLKSGVDVILDFGFWTKSERDEFRQKVKSFGANFKIHYMDVPNDVIWERLSVRNKSAGENAIFYVGKEEFDEWAGLFEVPTKEELE